MSPRSIIAYMSFMCVLLHAIEDSHQVQPLDNPVSSSNLTVTEYPATEGMLTTSSRSSPSATPVKLFRYAEGFLGRIAYGTPFLDLCAFCIPSSTAASTNHFNVMFDTGSGLTWLFGKDIRDSGVFPEAGQGNFNHNYYDGEEESKTWMPHAVPGTRKFEAGYGGGKGFSGKTFASDKLQIGNSIVIPDMKMALVDTRLGEATGKDTELDGIVGLNFGGREEVPNVTVRMLRDKFHGDGFIDEKTGEPKYVFSFYYSSFEDQQHLGQILFGRVDHSLYEGDTMTVVRVQSPFSWVIQLDSLKIGNDVMLIKNMPTELDSGSADNYLPRDVISKLIESMMPGPVRQIRMHGKGNENNFKYEAPCKSLKDKFHLTFCIGGKDFTLGIHDYYTQIREEKGHPVCRLRFLPTESILPDAPNRGEMEMHPALLGYPFLRQFYTVFDFGQRQVRIAKAAKKRLVE